MKHFKKVPKVIKFSKKDKSKWGSSVLSGAASPCFVIKEGVKKIVIQEKKIVRKRKNKYKEYINSSSWRKRKASFFMSECNKKCHICASLKELHVHHMTYKNIGNEKDSELVTLCKTCHFNLHEFVNLNKKPLFEGSEEFIKQHVKLG